MRTHKSTERCKWECDECGSREKNIVVEFYDSAGSIIFICKDCLIKALALIEEKEE